jgi:hypothetical protein
MVDTYASSVLMHVPCNQETYARAMPIDVSASGFRFTNLTASQAGNYDISVKKYGNASYYFGNSGTSRAFQSTSKVSLGSSDFTLELWFYPMTGSGHTYKRLIEIGPESTAGGLWILANGSVDNDTHSTPFVQGYSSGAYLNLGNPSLLLSLNAWHHLALVKSGTTWYFFLDGALVSTITSTYSFADGIMYIGGSPDGGRVYNGYIDDFRITLAARYTAAFTPPDAIDYTYQSPTGLILPKPVSLSAFAVPPPSTSQQVAIAGSRDIYFGGDGYIAGTTKVKGNSATIAVSRRVRLFEKISGILVAETWSDASGAFTFSRINRDYTYFVMTNDYAKSYESVVGDNLTPGKMS